MSDILRIGALNAFVLLFVMAPLTETAIECVLPYRVLNSLIGRQGAHAWFFIFVSSSLLTMLHIGIYGMAFLPQVPSALLTGAFLAYCFAHFAGQSLLKAFLYTCLLHALMNVSPFLRMFVF